MKPTQEQVIAWALKCGASIKTDCNGNGAFGSGVDLNALATLAYEAGRKDENEECAKVCEGLAEVEIMPGFTASTRTDQFECAAAIRARREQ